MHFSAIANFYWPGVLEGRFGKTEKKETEKDPLEDILDFVLGHSLLPGFFCLFVIDFDFYRGAHLLQYHSLA
jgi:hypothetical protein